MLPKHQPQRKPLPIAHCPEHTLMRKFGESLPLLPPITMESVHQSLSDDGGTGKDFLEAIEGELQGDDKFVRRSLDADFCLLVCFLGREMERGRTCPICFAKNGLPRW